MSSAAPAVIDATLELLNELFPDALSSYGPPGMDLPNDIAAVTGLRISDESPTVGGPRRAVEETVNVEVTFSCYEPGGTEVSQPVTVRAFAMLDALQDALRDRTVATLGGSCREAHVTDVDGSALAQKIVDPDTGAVMGRSTELVVTVACKKRI